MADARYDALAGLRQQIIDNCLFLARSKSVRMSVAVAHEVIGTYRAIAVANYGRRSEVVLSSDSFDTVVKALEHLMTKSADAVGQNVMSTGFGRLISTIDHDNADRDDDGSSVSSYADELDKEGLANSGLSLESEVESVYDSMSEDDHHEGGIRYGGSKQKRPRPSSLSWFTGGSPIHVPSRRPTDSRDAGRQPRYPTYNPPVDRRRPSPPRAAPAAHASKVSADGFQPELPPPRPRVPGVETWPQVLSRLRKESTGLWPQNNSTSSDPKFLDIDNGTGNPATQHGPLPPPGVVLPMRAPPSQYFSSPRTAWALGAGRSPAQQQQQQQQQQAPVQQKPPVKSNYPGSASVPPVMQMPPLQMRLPPLSSGLHPPGLVPSSTSHASSPASSAPTLTPTPNNLPEHTPPRPPPAPTGAPSLPSLKAPQRAPDSIDYRVSIVGGPCSGQEHRFLARSPPTRAHIRNAALRYIMLNYSTLFPKGSGGSLPVLHARTAVTKAVFTVAGREESYDLAAYAEEDLTRLCEGMAAAAAVTTAGGGQGGAVGAAGWPLFEVTLPQISAALDDEIVDA